MEDVYVINLAENIERHRTISETFKNSRLNLIRVNTIKNEKREIGCFLSHKKCIQYAKDKGLKILLLWKMTVDHFIIIILIVFQNF